MGSGGRLQRGGMQPCISHIEINAKTAVLARAEGGASGRSSKGYHKRGEPVRRACAAMVWRPLLPPRGLALVCLCLHQHYTHTTDWLGLAGLNQEQRLGINSSGGCEQRSVAAATGH